MTHSFPTRRASDLGSLVPAFGVGSSPFKFRHAELVSASMAGLIALRCAGREGGPWTLKQVQGDEKRSRLPADHRHSVRDARFRSEEHTSELQSLMRNSYAVFCLKKKNQ